MTCMRARRSLKFGQIRLLTAELAALEHLKNPHRLIMGKNCVATFSHLFLIKSFSYLQLTMTYIRAWISLKFGQIPSGITELASLEHQKIDVAPFSHFTVVVIPGK